MSAELHRQLVVQPEIFAFETVFGDSEEDKLSCLKHAVHEG